LTTSLTARSSYIALVSRKYRTRKTSKREREREEEITSISILRDGMTFSQAL